MFRMKRYVGLCTGVLEEIATSKFKVVTYRILNMAAVIPTKPSVLA